MRHSNAGIRFRIFCEYVPHLSNLTKQLHKIVDEFMSSKLANVALIPATNYTSEIEHSADASDNSTPSPNNELDLNIINLDIVENMWA